jgi:uncharacterized protein DUF6508
LTTTWSDEDRATRLRALADLLPVLTAPDADFGRWVVPPPKDGIQSLGWYEFGPAGEAFQRAVGGWILPGFDWRAWVETVDGIALREPAGVATASSDQLAMLLTAIVRSDRFVEGSIAGAFESGLLAAICRRAVALLGGRASS